MLSNLLRKLIPKNIAAIIGFIQALIPVIREVLMVATRICAVVIPGDKDDAIVAQIKVVFDEIVLVFEKLKDFFLKVGA